MGTKLYFALAAGLLMASAPDDREVRCKREIGAMASFLAARENLACSKDADCVVVDTPGCSRGMCGGSRSRH